MATSSDRVILNSIFNPNLPLGECPIDDEQDIYDDDEEEIASPELEEAKQLEVEGVKFAEKGELMKAIEIFTKAIEIIPNRASGYNNRAQAYRLAGKNEEALEDANRAVELSGGRGGIAAKSLCQRGLLLQLRGESKQALADYQAAAKQGSEFGKMMSIQLNPYAALCNQMLAEVIKKLQNGQPLH